VLIHDSLADNRRIVRELLACNAAWTVVESSSPQDALNTLSEQDVAVVLTDLNVPDLNGQPFIEAMRSQFPQIPTVVISPAGPDRAVVRALTLGAASYVPRTALARDLGGTVERLIALAGPQPEGDRVRPYWIGTKARFTIPSDQAAAQTVIQYLQHELARYGICGPDHRTRVGMALTEALANAILHGNLELSSVLCESDRHAFDRELVVRKSAAPYRDRIVRLSAVFEPAGATFTIADEGSGFDLSKVPDPTDEENLTKVTGRGLLLMRAFTDQLAFNNSGNEVTMHVTARPPRLRELVSVTDEQSAPPT
jgi:DNA-binding NarL/FixJ family response regulator